MASSRYAYVDSNSSPSPSNLKKHPNNFSLNHILTNSNRSLSAPDNPSLALTRTRTGTDLAPSKNGHGFGTMVKKFMEKRSNLKPGKAGRVALPIPVDVIAGDLNKSAAKSGGSNLTALHKKLFQKGGSADRTATKALTEVKTNTRTLAMVLRSERELLSQNKEYVAEVSGMRLLLEEKNREAEKLKDLCLKQREEIKALKDALLFPDIMNSQLKDLLERREPELKQAKQIIPGLQKQVASLTGQIECLKEDLAEVKADKYSARTCFDGSVNSPRTPILDHESANSLEYSSGDPSTCGLGSPDDMFLNDLNPCLTPYFAKNKSKEFDDMSMTSSPDMSNSRGGMISRSSDHCDRTGDSAARKFYRSDESKWSAGKPRYQNLFGA